MINTNNTFLDIKSTNNMDDFIYLGLNLTPVILTTVVLAIILFKNYLNKYLNKLMKNISFFEEEKNNKDKVKL